MAVGVRAMQKRDYADAESQFKKALKLASKPKQNHEQLAITCNHLGDVYRLLRRDNRAESFYRRAVDSAERAWGAEHPEVATHLNNLAAFYYSLAKYDEAERLFKRALNIREKTLGPHDLHVATSLYNLGATYLAHGRFGAAPFFSLGPGTVVWTGPPLPIDIVLDMVSRSRGIPEPQPSFRKARLALAEEPLSRALTIRESLLGADHPDTRCLKALAVAYRAQGAFDKAEPLLLRALAAEEKTLGSDHRSVAGTLVVLGLVYGAQGKYSEAEAHFARSLMILEKALPQNDPSVAAVLEFYSEILRKLNRAPEADQAMARAQAIRAANAKN